MAIARQLIRGRLLAWVRMVAWQTLDMETGFEAID